MNLDDEFESLIIEGHEIKKCKWKGEKCLIEYLFYREKHPEAKDFVLVYAGSNENAWRELRWWNGNGN